MNADTEKPRPERDETDESLRTERKNTDEALAETRTRIEKTADGIVDLAREKADAVLDSARDRADGKLDAAHADAEARGVVERERAREDKALEDERSAADESIRREREERARALATLLPLEREKTDRHLLSERERSDDAIAHRDDFLDAVDLISEAAGTFAHAAQEKGGALDFATAAPHLPAVFDHERMFQVLANLIANALRFTARGGAVTLHAELSGDGVQVSVRDTGAGISGEVLESIFERFWQVGKNDHRGLGLGLYISRCIVDAHGGRIWAESRPGAGSTFHVRIPAGGPAIA